MALVFVTKEYEGKVNDKGPKGSIDNCYLEFHHIVRQLTPSRIITVVMESEMRDPRKWVGALGIGIAGRIFVDMTGDGLFSTYTTVLLLQMKDTAREGDGNQNLINQKLFWSAC